MGINAGDRLSQLYRRFTSLRWHSPGQSVQDNTVTSDTFYVAGPWA